MQRRGRAVILQPRPIAMKLAERRWREWSGADWDAVLAGDASSELKVQAARQLRWLDTTEVAPKVVQHVCRFGGPFDGFEGISRTDHAEVLSALAEVDPEAVAGQIERCLDDVEDLSKVEGDARRHLSLGAGEDRLSSRQLRGRSAPPAAPGGRGERDVGQQRHGSVQGSLPRASGQHRGRRQRAALRPG